MSFEAAAWAIKQTPGTQTDKLVLIALCDCLNSNTQRCDPSNAHLAEAAMCSEKYVYRSLSRLELSGLITVERTLGRRNRYSISIPEETEVATPQLSEVVTPQLSGEVELITPQLSGPTPQLSGQTPQLSGDEPRRTKKGTKKEKLCVVKRSIPLGVEPGLWEEFLSMRKTLKAVNSDRAITALTNKIEKFGQQNHDVNEIIEKSLVSSWKDVYKPRKERHDGNSQRNHQQTATELLLNMDW